MTLDIEQLWDEYSKNPTAEVKALLAAKYSGLVYKIAIKFLHKKPSVFDFDDIIQDGTLGLLDAIDKFDPGRGFQFSTYAQARIRGAIIDGINVMDWTPRRIKKEIRSVLTAIEEHGEDNYEEIAKSLNIPVQEVKDTIKRMSKTYIVPMDFETIIMHSPLTDAESAETTSEVKIIIERLLTMEEQEIVRMSFFEGYPNTEISRITSLTLKEVKDLKDSAIEKLRHELKILLIDPLPPKN